VLHVASLHLAQNLPNLFSLESVRRHYLRDYCGLVNFTGPAEGGTLRAPDASGLGVELDRSVFQRADVHVATIE
jgi:L-alanine-DL-glutamate epimerase-like enolase superfamily enzyme